jgi:asparagine synthase (glutamine-hydrolysing)
MCARDTLLRGKEVVRWHLEARGLGRLMGPGRRPYKDYNLWFRTVLRNWVEETLLSPRALERGYFNPDYVRVIVSEHMAGANYAVRIGALMSIELWHRMYVD